MNIDDVKYKIKDSIWGKYLRENNLCKNTPNPGSQNVASLQMNAPYQNQILLTYPNYWFYETDLEKICSVCNVADTYTWQHCPKCHACPRHQEVRNFDRMWGEGDVICGKCETKVRTFDSG